MIQKEIYVCTYGCEGYERGIVKLTFNLQTKELTKKFVLPLDGKCNMVTKAGNRLYLCIKRIEGSFIEVFDAETYECISSTPSDYFYSYGQVVGDKFLLASYESGVDSVFDLNTQCFTAHCVHQREGFEGHGKSHYIQCLKDGQIVGIENGLQQIYLYENMNLDVKKVIDYPPINIRLLTTDGYSSVAYLNTEISNEMISLSTKDWSEICRRKMADQEGWYSGGNAISPDGEIVCASVRGQDRIHVFYTNGGLLFPAGSFGCGRIPRDLKFVSDYLFISCTGDNKIEVIDFTDIKFRKCAEIEVAQPITFEMESRL